MCNIYQHLWEKKYLSLKDITSDNELINIKANLCINNIRQVVYHAIYKLDKIPTCLCGANLQWNSDLKSYRKYCSTSCTATFSKNQRKETCIEKYGVDHFSKTADFSLKIQKTSIEKFGVLHYSQGNEFKERVKDTNISNFGVEFPSQNVKIIEKTKKTCIERLGVDNPAKSKTVQEKIKKTNLEKYNVECVLKSIVIQKKIKQTNIDRYGVENVNQNLEVVKKRSKSRQENYYSAEVLGLLQNKEWLIEQNKLGKTVGEISKELNVSSSNLCKIFNKLEIDIVRHFSSSEEKIISNFLNELGVEHLTNNRSIIHPFELDIVIPSISLAIEINGGYWHHEEQGKHKNYHLQKSKECQKKGIELWHFFDWDVQENLEIIKSKIVNKLNRSFRIYSRKLKIAIISDSDKTKFLNENHLQGSCSSKINLGLVNNDNELLSIMTFGKSRFNKNYNWELLRFCSKINTSVIGGASKLLTFFRKHHMLTTDTLISYCNLRFSIGNVYTAIGFEYMHSSPPNYMYVTKSGKNAGSRNQWQKHLLSEKLELFDPELSANENMKQNGYFRIWDCGNYVFKYTNNGEKSD